MPAFTAFLALALAAASASPGASTPEPASREPLWQSVLLAPGRVVGHGRFDAARPSYHAERAAEKAAKEEARAARCPECACEVPER